MTRSLVSVSLRQTPRLHIRRTLGSPNSLNLLVAEHLGPGMNGDGYALEVEEKYGDDPKGGLLSMMKSKDQR